MLIIPAIDLKNGRCVRLVHGEESRETIYSDNPVAMARKWVEEGAERLHVVDLDGAFAGEPKNLDWVVRIRQEVKIPVQLGGGLRTAEAVGKVIEAGVDFAILGTVLFTNQTEAEKICDKYGDKIIVGLDARDGQVSIKGWKDSSGVSLEEAVKKVESLGVKQIIYTDIGRDGTLEGSNVEATKDLMSKTSVTIWASGGVSSIDDITRLNAIGSPGCIVGKALYEGKFKLGDAIQKAKFNVI